MGGRVSRLCLVLLGAALGFGQLQHEVRVVNISVPVRVFDGDRFVDSLGLKDFEVYEDGTPQPIQAVYLIKGKEIKRKEAPVKTSHPATGRTFVLFFQMTEYLPEIDKALDLFFESVYLSGDAIDIVTPRKTYRLRGRVDSSDKMNKTQREVKFKIRQDILAGSAAYKSIIHDILYTLDAPEPDLNAYRTDLDRLEALCTLDTKRMAAFAAELKGRPGAKHVFLFYQKNRAPQFSSRKLAERISDANSSEVLELMDLTTGFSRREVHIDQEAIRKTFSDASIDIHFLYVTRNRFDPQMDVESPARHENAQMAEISTDLYRVFREIAAATGGTAEASANPSTLLRKAAEASEQYYLLYYQPQGYQADEKFHRIDVKVKQGGLRVSHREGYIATEVALPVKPETGSQEEGGQDAGQAEDIDLTRSASAKGAPVPDGILEAAGAYCRRLEEASLYFVCREEVKERLAADLVNGSPATEIIKRAAASKLLGPSLRYQVHAWVYDYQLFRKKGWASETRILLEEDGKVKREENASLKTSRFEHKFVVLGPVGLLSEKAQFTHDYRIVQETDIEGEPVLVIDVRPSGEETSSLFGRAWVRERDGAVLKVEWEPISMRNYAAIEDLAKQSGAQPRFKFSSEYSFETSGLRFPSSYEVTEAYHISIQTVTLSTTNVVYKDYKFFQVEVKTSIR